MAAPGRIPEIHASPIPGLPVAAYRSYVLRVLAGDALSMHVLRDGPELAVLASTLPRTRPDGPART